MFLQGHIHVLSKAGAASASERFSALQQELGGTGGELYLQLDLAPQPGAGPRPSLHWLLHWQLLSWQRLHWLHTGTQREQRGKLKFQQAKLSEVQLID